MHLRVLRIDYRFSYRQGWTRARLLAVLAKEWHGWEQFPWRITRHMHLYLTEPPVNFRYLMVHLCLTGYAAHLVLTARFVDRNRVLDMMLREGFQFVGTLRMLMIEAIWAELRRTGYPYIFDASGPEDGHFHLKAKEIERRRAVFRKCFEGATSDFVAILNLASLSEKMQESYLARSLRYWAAGGELPAAVPLEVQATVAATGTELIPCEAELRRIAAAKKPYPTVVLEKGIEELLGWEAEGKDEGRRLNDEGEGSAGMRECASTGKGNGKEGVGKDEGRRLNDEGEGSAGKREGVSSGKRNGKGTAEPQNTEPQREDAKAGPRIAHIGNEENGTDGTQRTKGTAGVPTDMKVRELKEHLDTRIDALGREYAGLKQENESLKRGVAAVLATLGKSVEPEFFQWVVVILGAGSVLAAAQKFGMSNSTLDDKLKRYVRKGGDYRKLYAMVEARQKGLGKKSIVHFNEWFSEHQGTDGAAEASVLKELLDGLEGMNSRNWDGVRTELVEIAKGMLPEI